MGSNISEYDGFSYKKIRDYSPPLTEIAIKHVCDIYNLCEENRNTGLKKSEIFINISSFFLGLVSVATYIDKTYLVVCFVVVAVFFYTLWLLTRREENKELKEFSNNIMSLMPLSKDEVNSIIANNKRIEEDRINSFLECSKPIY